MWKRIARAVVPGPIRRILQKWKLDRQVKAYPRRVVEHTYGGVRLKIELADGLAAGWYDHDWPTLPELRLLTGGRLIPGARVFDLGAHQGVVGLMFGHAVGPTGRVLLVEANPHNAAACGRNVALNAMPWVEPLQAAVSDREGTLRFGGGLNGAAAEVSDYAGTFDVPAVTVDSLAERYGPPDVVFVDVEGFELRALAGAGKTLGTVADWFIEVHQGCGLETAGGSATGVLDHFPPERYECWVHSEGDTEPVRLATAPASKLQSRFFLTAIHRADAAVRA